MPLLEPRTFSFASGRRLPTCDGLGYQDFFDPERVAVDPHLSLAGGAVRGGPAQRALLRDAAIVPRHYQFDVETLWIELDERVQRVLLDGSGEEQIEFRYKEGATPRASVTRSRASRPISSVASRDRLGRRTR